MARVLDVVNKVPVAVVDAAVETHMLDLLIYKTDAKMELPGRRFPTPFRSPANPAAGDVFGTYRFHPRPWGPRRLRRVRYTMVKTNWFNGLRTPALVIRRLDVAGTSPAGSPTRISGTICLEVLRRNV